MRFDGKRVLVTGGSRGIGRAVCDAFAEAGARVAVHSSATSADVDPPHVAVIGDVADAAAGVGDVLRAAAPAGERARQGVNGASYLRT